MVPALFDAVVDVLDDAVHYLRRDLIVVNDVVNANSLHLGQKPHPTLPTVERTAGGGAGPIGESAAQDGIWLTGVLVAARRARPGCCSCVVSDRGLRFVVGGHFRQLPGRP